MAQPIRYHLDEHVATLVAEGLRRRGIDVTTSADAGLQGADDRTQLAFAVSQGRVLVTQDADFLRMAHEGAPHAGIVFIVQRMHHALTHGEVLRALVVLGQHLDAEEMRDHVEYI